MRSLVLVFTKCGNCHPSLCQSVGACFLFLMFWLLTGIDKLHDFFLKSSAIVIPIPFLKKFETSRGNILTNYGEEYLVRIILIKTYMFAIGGESSQRPGRM